MNITKFEGLSRAMNRQLLKAKKSSPRWMFAAGITGTVVSTVLACRATLKLEEKLEAFREEVDEVKEAEQYALTKRDYQKDLAYVYVKGTYSIAKLYAPAVIVGASSIAALTGSHVTLSRRNASLTAAYSALQLSFDAYKERVKEELGEEKELDIRNGMIDTTVENESGKKETVKMVNSAGISQYAKFFDEGSPNWQKSPELNRLFIQCQQNYANHLLHARGHVFLNEVYDMLGLDRTKAGQVVGWVIGDKDHPGDNYIDFGLFEVANARFINGWERSILLDFNVDGVIYDKI